MPNISILIIGLQAFHRKQSLNKCKKCMRGCMKGIQMTACLKIPAI